MMRALLVLTFVVLGCVGDPLPLTNCTAGVQTSCACPGGAAGAQRCAADGSGYGACDCPDAAPVDAVAAADVVDAPPMPDAITVDVVRDVAVADAPRDTGPDMLCAAGQTMCGAGCADTMTSPGNCGRCGNVCPEYPHVVTVCAAGTCGNRGCRLGWVECNFRVSDGCEVDGTTDPDNCGGCGRVCPSRHCFEAQCAP